MRKRKPHLTDTLPIQRCVLCNRPFCADHKGEHNGVCEIDHVSYYRNHPALQNYLYRTYEDWRKGHEQVIVDEMSGNEDPASV